MEVTKAPASKPSSPPPMAAYKRKPLGDLSNAPDTSPQRPVLRSECSSSPTPASNALRVIEENVLVKSAISTTYTRRKTESRRCTKKSVLPEAASCPLIARVRTTKKTSVTQDAQRISSSVPYHRAKRKQNAKMDHSSASKPTLPEDFVKKQRAYFAEVDAFELQEEETSDVDQY